MATVTKKKKVQEMLNSPEVIDTSCDMNLPIQEQMVEKKYKCTCCGESWDKRTNHFAKTASPLFQSNGGYLPICNKCRDRYYNKLVKLYNGNEIHAIRHFCIQFDIIFELNALAASRRSGNVTRISSYLSQRNLGQTTKVGTTYIDGMKYEYINHSNSINLEKTAIKSEVNDELKKKWGSGFSEEDYETLESHYNTLKENNPNCDNNQEIFIKSLCNLHMLSVRALKNGDIDKYTKLVEQYSKTFKTTGLRTIEEKDDSNESTLGVTLATISQYTPEEFYKDKDIYKDFDGIGEYVERFMTRPLSNLEYGTTDRDKEYFVPEDEDVYE